MFVLFSEKIYLMFLEDMTTKAIALWAVSSAFIIGLCVFAAWITGGSVYLPQIIIPLQHLDCRTSGAIGHQHDSPRSPDRVLSDTHKLAADEFTACARVS